MNEGLRRELRRVLAILEREAEADDPLVELIRAALRMDDERLLRAATAVAWAQGRAVGRDQCVEVSVDEAIESGWLQPGDAEKIDASVEKLERIATGEEYGVVRLVFRLSESGRELWGIRIDTLSKQLRQSGTDLCDDHEGTLLADCAHKGGRGHGKPLTLDETPQSGLGIALEGNAKAEALVRVVEGLL